MPDEGEYLSVEDAAVALGRSLSTIWRLIKRYQLQTFRRPMDRKTYLRKTDVDQLPETFEPREKTKNEPAGS